MPLPKRHADEEKADFITRCMADPTMVEEYPEADQRRAVCERQAEASGERAVEFLSAPEAMEIEAAADGTRLPRFTMVAYTGRAMRLAWWRYPVVVDLAGLVIPSQHRSVRFNHDADKGVGHTTRIYVEDGALVAAGTVSRGTREANEVLMAAKNGFQWQCSIGASVEKFETVREGAHVMVNGQDFTGPINVVRAGTLGEISFVDLGADDATSAKLKVERRRLVNYVKFPFDYEAQRILAGVDL